MAEQLALIHVPEVEVLDPEPALDMRDMMRMFVQAAVGQQPPKLSEHEKEIAWATAFDEWLAENPKTGEARPANTIRAYGAAWEDFRLCCPKRPWLVTGLDVQEWVSDLRCRPIQATVEKGLIANGRRKPGQAGLSGSTINQWLAGISAFYSFCQNRKVRGADGREVVLFADLNPAKSHEVQRPKVEPWNDVAYLDGAQVKALLAGIRSAQTLAEVARPAVGQTLTLRAQRELRDYALFYSFFATGARNSEIRKMTWGDIKCRGGQVFYDWVNKGKHGPDELPLPAWQAIEAWLRATGRLATIQPGDAIFTPLGDHVTRLRRADGTPIVGADWDTNHPLSQSEVNRLLRRYARAAGLAEVERLHVHSLRHSKAMMLDACGVGLREIGQELHHSGLDMTGKYLHAVAGQRNSAWAICTAKFDL